MRNFVFLYCVTKEIVKWRSNFKLMLEIVLAWGNRHHFETSPLVLPRSDNWRASPEFPLTFPLDLGSASSWLKICFKSNQKHCWDTGRDASLVRNLCALSRETSGGVACVASASARVRAKKRYAWLRRRRREMPAWGFCAHFCRLRNMWKKCGRKNLKQWKFHWNIGQERWCQSCTAGYGVKFSQPCTCKLPIAN